MPTPESNTAEMQKLMKRLERGVTSNQENATIVDYIRTLEKEHREMRSQVAEIIHRAEKSEQKYGTALVCFSDSLLAELEAIHLSSLTIKP